jgi:oxygen-dependent protoporphyrinogen oxidase
MAQPHAIIVGAGIAGVTAGFRLQRGGWRVTLLEQSSRAGGRMRTIAQDGFTIDVGAGILPSCYKAVLRLISDTGLDHLIVPVGGKVAVPRAGKMHYLAMANLQRSMLTTALLPWASKLRLLRIAYDLWRSGDTLGYDTLGRVTRYDDTTAAEYGRRNLDPELMDYLVEPTLRTLYLSNADEASIVEFFWCMKNLSAASSFCLLGGMDRLAAEIAAMLPVTYGATVGAVRETDGGTRVTWADAEGDRHDDRADACIVATDGKVVAALVGGCLTQRQSAYLANMRYSVSVNLHFGLSRDPGVDALIVQVPRPQDAALVALVMDHLKGPGRAPPGKGLVSAFFETGWGKRMLGATDDEIFADAIPRIERIIPGFGSMMEVRHVERWRHAATITVPGQCAEIAAFEADQRADSRIILASDLYAPSSVNTCVTQGELAVRKAMALS